jgi:hypothetical protein
MPITTLKKLEADTARDAKDDFYERGWDQPKATWNDALKFSRAYGLVDAKLKPVNRASAKILSICKKEFLRGQSDKREPKHPPLHTK